MKNSMNVKIAMLVAASEYARLTLEAASSFSMAISWHYVGEPDAGAAASGMGVSTPEAAVLRSALTQQAVSTPRWSVSNERRRRRPPPGRTGTTRERPPAARGSPPTRAADGYGRAPPPRGRG